FVVRREHPLTSVTALRDEPALRFEMCMGVNGVPFPGDRGRELHAVYPFLSITHNRRVRVEVTCPDDDRHIPSIVSVYPANDWQTAIGEGQREFLGRVVEPPAVGRLRGTGHDDRRHQATESRRIS
ncbi:MAG: NADH-quinone oxidoreductase subunit C, partial [Actinomycetota bacterium]